MPFFQNVVEAISAFWIFRKCTVVPCTCKKKRHKPKRWDQVTPSYPPDTSKNLSLTLGPDHKSTLSGFEHGYPEFQHLTAQHCNQSTTHFRSAIVIFRLIEAARCKNLFSLQGFPHVSDNTATKGTVCLGGQGHNPGDWEAVRRKIGPPNCPAELLGFLRRIGGVVA